MQLNVKFKFPKPLNKRDTSFVILLLSFIFFKIQIFSFLAGIELFVNFKTSLAFFGSVLIFTSWTFLFSQSTKIYSLVFLNFFLSVIVLADSLYYKFYGDIISIALLQCTTQLNDFSNSIFQLMSPKYCILLFLDLFLLVLTLYYFNLNKKNFSIHIKSLHTRIRHSIIVFLVGLNLVVFQAIDHEKLFSSGWQNIIIAKYAGVLGFHEIDIYNYVKYRLLHYDKITEEEKNSIYQWLKKERQNKNGDYLNGIAKGKNVIIIQVESLQDFVINKKINGREVTPNINNFIKNSVYFSNIYSQTYTGGTSDAEFITLTSLYPLSDVPVFVVQANSDYKNALPFSLKNSGYSTAAYHGYKKSFWNRAEMYKRLGINNFESEENYYNNKENSLGIEDDLFFEQTSYKLEQLKQPFFALIVSLSSHHPYNYLDDYDGLNIKGYENLLIGDYFNSIHFADAALGNFLEQLEAKGYMDNSLIVIYGDHKAIRDNKEDGLYKFYNFNYKDEIQQKIFDEKLNKVPFIIHFPNEIVKGKRGTIGGHVDFYPTIANLLGLEKPYGLGKDLFNSKDQFAIFSNGQYIDDNYFFDATELKWYSIKTKQPIDGTFKDKEETIYSYLDNSQKIIQNNLFDFSKN